MYKYRVRNGFRIPAIRPCHSVARVDLAGEFELYVVVSIAFPPSCSYLFHPYLSLFYSHLSQFVDILLLVRLIE
jgi:hypothetical protein